MVFLLPLFDCGEGFKMDAFDAELLAVVAGFYFADRSLGKRGK